MMRIYKNQRDKGKAVSLYDAPDHAQRGNTMFKFYGNGWNKLKQALLRAFDREREMIRLRVAMGMMAEARYSDAKEHRETADACRALHERVRQLEEERDAWRAGTKAATTGDKT